MGLPKNSFCAKQLCLALERLGFESQLRQTLIIALSPSHSLCLSLICTHTHTHLNIYAPTYARLHTHLNTLSAPWLSQILDFEPLFLRQ